MLSEKGMMPAQAPAAPQRLRRRRRRWPMVIGLAIVFVIAAGLLVYLDPAIVPQVVDDARAIVGPAPVAWVEALVFQAQDTVRQARYQATGAATHVEWAAPAQVAPAPLSSAGSAAPLAQPGLPASGNQTQLASSASQSALVWSPFVATPDGRPALERALVSPDSTRPYAEAALVRIDLRAASLHLVAGTQEPISSVRVPRPGLIAAADRRPERLLAAFNGGFKAANGDFGMGVNGTTLLPPIDGLATLAIYRDGRVAMGAWGQELISTPDMVAFRQNCPLLLDGGQPTVAASIDEPHLWGKTVGNKVATWRSGLGLTADGRYLIYAAGDSLTVSSLAEALAAGGADRAMQLDINSWWTRFVTYAPTADGHLVAQKLLTSMVGDRRQFLAPDTRDFFYVTAR